MRSFHEVLMTKTTTSEAANSLHDKLNSCAARGRRDRARTHVHALLSTMFRYRRNLLSISRLEYPGVCRDLLRVRLNRFEDLAALRVGYQKYQYNIQTCRIVFWTS